MRPLQSNAMGDLRCEASGLKADSVPVWKCLLKTGQYFPAGIDVSFYLTKKTNQHEKAEEEKVQTIEDLE